MKPKNKWKFQIGDKVRVSNSQTYPEVVGFPVKQLDDRHKFPEA